MRPFINTKLNDPKPHDFALNDQLSPKQVRNTATASISVKRKHPNHAGFLSNDQVLPPQFDQELESMK